MKVLLIVLLMAGAASAQATRPGEAEDLRRIIRQLQQQVAELRAENAALRKQAVAPATRPTVATGTFSQRAEKHVRELRMPRDLAAGVLADAKKMDAAVGQYLAQHETTPELATAMWAGTLKIGMTEEQMKVLGTWSLLSEATTVQAYGYQTKDPIGIRDVYDVVVANGHVAQITMRLGGP